MKRQRRGGRAGHRQRRWGSGVTPRTIWIRGKQRQLLIPRTRSDRAVCRAIHAELSPRIEPCLAETVYGFRPRRSRFGAAEHARSLPGKHRLAVDIVDFFNSIDHKRFVNFDVFPSGIWARMKPFVPPNGLAQGVNFSPVLSNLYLADIDHDFPNVIRYADDLLIVSDEPFEVRRQLAARLKTLGLQLHDDDVLDPKSWLSVDLQTLECVAAKRRRRIIIDRQDRKIRFFLRGRK